MKLMPHQEEVLNRISNGKIVWGGVGSGKSLVALSYYLERELVGDVIVITTAKKRDSLEWEGEAARLGIGTRIGSTVAGVLSVDSWNNISKYVDRRDCFFIFDEQRLIGSGAWVKSFYRIAKSNAWLILSATPGDTWMDYIPVFIANGFYKNRTEFIREHVVFDAYSRYPKIKMFLNVDKLEKLKRDVLVPMPYESSSLRVHKEVKVPYDAKLLATASVDRWNPFEDKPIENPAQLFAIMRRIVWADHSRLDALRELLDKHPKIIVFYSYNYELEILRELNDTWSDVVQVAEWNGHKKQPIPDSDSWVYLVQYSAGSEGWNCTETDTMVFWSLTYSYKQYEQAQGRIDRLNTYYSKLYYYTMISGSIVDRAVQRALKNKESFNEKSWVDEHLPNF